MTFLAESRKGAFITLEGDDGVGKSTQADLLARALEASGYEVLRVHEPGGTVLGEKIRSLLLDKDNDGMAPLAELFLYEAARAQVMQDIVCPALEQGKVVICDRFVDSTLAYQGYGRGLERDMVRNLNSLACCGIMPACTLLLALDPDLASTRVRERSADGAGDRMECAGDDFHARLRQGFFEIAQDEPSRVRLIDASGTIDEIHELVCACVQEALGITIGEQAAHE